jgi:capsular polysaccharide transport system permease protein
VEALPKERTQIQLRKLREINKKPDVPQTKWGVALAFLRKNWLFVIVVIIPVVLNGLYNLLVASNIYVSEAKYVVRTPSDSANVANPLSGIVQSSGISKATDDAHAINAFFLSRDAMEILRGNAGLDEVYGSAKGDFLSRYPRFSFARTGEGQFKYFLKMASVQYDKTTGISTLSVAAFDPKDAQAIARKLMESGEALANRLTVRMRADLVQRAQQEADLARGRAHEAQRNITQWRNRETQIDPTRFSAAIIEVIARLSLELAQLRAQKAEMVKASPQSPAIASLQNRITSLEDQVNIERRSLAGSVTSLAPKIVEYELLQLEKMMAEKLFSATITSLEVARSDAQKQQIYLERIVDPQLADYPSRPERLLSMGMVALISLMVFMVLKKILTNIAHHGAFARYFNRRRAV